MNNYMWEARKRSQTLLIVEGNHEKNKLFWLLFKCFPEISIDMENVWIYGTNIYLLYEDIVKEYGENWAEEEIDIDLPFVISKKQSPDSLRYKDDFTNILLVFDYERHDTNFSEIKILNMQNKFSDAADMGKLYINYPMIESYQHLRALPDQEYKDRKIPVRLQPGSKYKELVSNETIISNAVDFPHRIDDLMDEHFGITDAEIRNKCCEAILNISTELNLIAKLEDILSDALEMNAMNTLKYQLKAWISRVGYAHEGKSYWQYLKEIFTSIIFHNICKANWIQNSRYEVEEVGYKNCFEHLDLSKILEIQNDFSKDDITGHIWVLNTCVFLVADYNFALLQN